MDELYHPVSYLYVVSQLETGLFSFYSRLIGIGLQTSKLQDITDNTFICSEIIFFSSPLAVSKI